MCSVATNLVTSLEFIAIHCVTTLCHFGRSRNGYVTTFFILLNSTAESIAKSAYVVVPERCQTTSGIGGGFAVLIVWGLSLAAVEWKFGISSLKFGLQLEHSHVKCFGLFVLELILSFLRSNLGPFRDQVCFLTDCSLYFPVILSKLPLIFSYSTMLRWFWGEKDCQLWKLNCI